MTNAALKQHLPAHLRDILIVPYRVLPIIRGNPLLLLICLCAVPFYHGLNFVRQPSSVLELMLKTPVFFRLASAMIRRRARLTEGLCAILQTQGLFDASFGVHPLIVYTDNFMSNDDNRFYAYPTAPSSLVALERRLFDRCAALVMASSRSAEAICRQYGVDGEKVSVAFMGSNAPNPIQSSDDRYTRGQIVFVGRHWQRKGGPVLLAAFRQIQVRHPGARLVIVGCRPAVPDASVEVVGRVSLAQMGAIMAESSIFCMPSLREPFGIAPLDAARAGLPVVATTLGGFEDSIADGQTGLLVPPGDVAALARALDELLSDPNRCRAFGEAGAIRSLRFEWSKVCATIATAISRQIQPVDAI